ncbi:MAG: helix-turn-helix transcriptional regulator [Peptococcaceae bacterium]|nr:helix-turn-helix transcriptional regulator [Peptococcaceae bacterium]
MPDLPPWAKDRGSLAISPEGTSGRFILERYPEGKLPQGVTLEDNRTAHYLLDISMTPVHAEGQPEGSLVKIHFCHNATGFTKEHMAKISPREREVFRLVIMGATNKSAAHYLGVTEGTVKKLLSNCYRKLGISSRSEALITYYSSH